MIFPLNNDEVTPLGVDFQPGPLDVLCQRGKLARDHNHHFRKIISEHVGLYVDCPTRVDKSVLVISLVAIIREKSPKGGFVRFCKNKKQFVEIGDRGSRQKVANELRSLMAERDRSKKVCPIKATKEKSRFEDYQPLRVCGSDELNNQQQQQCSPSGLLDLLVAKCADCKTRRSQVLGAKFDHAIHSSPDLDDCDSLCSTEETQSQDSEASVDMMGFSSDFFDDCDQATPASGDIASLLDSKYLRGLIEATCNTNDLEDLDIDSVFL